MRVTRIFFLTVLLNICDIPIAQAEETDQFTLPPTALQDIGPSASHALYQVLEKIITQTNEEILTLQDKAGKSRLSASKLVLRRKGNYIADLVYTNTGPGFPRWLRQPLSIKESKPVFYKERRPWKTVYWLVFSQSPLSLIGLAPTVNMYGHYLGTDKLGHFFMQGHTYYTIYMYYINHGKSAKQAHDAIVTYGQFLEHSYLGTLVNGVYSNGDLSGNYAGWKFYTNLTQSVQIGKQNLAPILVLKEGLWQFNQHVSKENLLKPYISDNLNEAFNPCRYTFMRNQIRRQIKKRCSDWITQKGLTQQMVEEKLKETRLWHGETYGHWLPASNAVTLNTCFAGK